MTASPLVFANFLAPNMNPTYRYVAERVGSLVGRRGVLAGKPDERLLAVFEDTRSAVVGIVAGTLGLSELPAGLRMAIRGWIAMVEECVLHWLDERPVAREELVEFLRRSALTMLPDALALGAAGASAPALAPVPAVPPPGAGGGAG